MDQTPLGEWDWWLQPLAKLAWPAVGLGPYDPLGARARNWDRWMKLRVPLEKKSSLSPSDLALRGRLRRFMGDPRAQEDIRLSLRKNRRDPAARLWSAELQLESDPRAALERLDGLPGFSADFYRGCAWILRGSPRQAAACFARAAGIAQSAAPLTQLLQAAALCRLRRYGEALSALEATGFPGAAWHWQRAYALKGLGRHAQARESIESAFRLFSELSADPLLDIPLRQETRLEDIPDSKPSAPKGPYRVLAAVRQAEDLRSPGRSRYEEAVSCLKQAAGWTPKSPWVMAYLGRGLDAMGRADEAGEALRRASTLAPDCGWIRAWRGHWLMRRGDSKAIAELRRAAAACPDYPFARAWLGGALRRAGQTTAAGVELEASLRMEPDYEWSHFELFEVRRRQRRWKEAALSVTEAFERESKFTWAQREDPASLRSALDDLNAAVRLNPAEALLGAWRAWVLLGLAEFAQARKELSRISGNAPAFVHYVWSEYWRSQGRLDRSEICLSKAVTLRVIAVYLGARGIERHLLGRLRGAQSDLSQAARLDGTAARPLCALGAVLVERGKPRQALSALDRALRLHPRFTQALAHRARAWSLLKKPALARRDIELSRQINPDCPWTALAAWPLEATPLAACQQLLRVVESGSEIPPRTLQMARHDLRRAALKARNEL